MNRTKRTLALTALVTLSLGTAAACASKAAPAPDGPEMTVYMSPLCGCCGNWVDHMEENGFVVTRVDTNDLDPVKERLGVPRHLQSCHTGVVEGYVVEGHVPADLVLRMLEERPEAVGLAVPGMPLGSPGMESIRKDPYDVFLFDSAGATEVFASR